MKNSAKLIAIAATPFCLIATIAQAQSAVNVKAFGTIGFSTLLSSTDGKINPLEHCATKFGPSQVANTTAKLTEYGNSAAGVAYATAAVGQLIAANPAATAAERTATCV